MNVDTIQLQIDEAGNGTLLIMLAVVAGYFIFYLRRSWVEVPGESWTHRWRRFYTYENKSALALFTIFSNASLKTGATWWAIHIHRHGDHYGAFVSALFVVGTIGILWGVVCLLRAMARYDWPRYRWVLMIAGSLVFGIVTLLL